MARYEEMDDLLHRVRERLLETPSTQERDERVAIPAFDTGQQNDHYDHALECAHTLVANAEALRELLVPEHAHTLTADQHSHLLSVLNSAIQELWSSEVSLRRTALSE